MSPQALIDAAKAPILAFNDKNWDRVRASITPDFVYDEVASGRKLQGADQVIPVWQGWAQAFPDSKATFNDALVSGNSVVFEVEIRACMIVEMTGEKAKAQRHYFDMATLFEQIGVKV